MKHIPSLDQEEKVDATLALYNIFLNALSHGEETIRGEDVYKMIRTAFNWEFIGVHTFVVLEIACKVTYSIVI